MISLGGQTIQIRDEVPPEFRKGKYSGILERMASNLANPVKVDRYATHESGHLIYFTNTGLIGGPDDAIFAPPTIYWDGDDIAQYSAAVQSKHILFENIDFYTKELLENISLSAAAASSFEVAFLGEDEDTKNAMEGDRIQLFKHCYKAMQRDSVPYTAKSLWPSAQRKTSGWLEANRESVSALVGIAKQVVFKRCFGLRVELSDKDLDASQGHQAIVTVLLQLLCE